MVRLVYSRPEWQAIAQELGSPAHRQAPPGVAERITTMLAESPDEWDDQRLTLELDDAVAAAVRAVHSRLAESRPKTGQQIASVDEANAIIRQHQQRPDQESS
jgi:hypothetical protein